MRMATTTLNEDAVERILSNVFFLQFSSLLRTWWESRLDSSGQSNRIVMFTVHGSRAINESRENSRRTVVFESTPTP
jgi:hypothetical protein